MSEQLHSSRVLVLDSGCGGLSVWQEIRSLLPALSTDYLADYGFFPYGDREPDALRQRLVRIIDGLLAAQADYATRPYCAVIVACNTASTAVLNDLRQRFAPLPFIGVVPAIKTAAQLTLNGRIGILATPGTLARQTTSDLIRQFAAECKVITQGSLAMVRWGEAAVTGIETPPELIRSEILPFLEHGCDQVVLGCTHFPLLRSQLESVAPQINWVDSGTAIARRTEYVIRQQSGGDSANVLNDPGRPVHRFLHTGQSLALELTTALHRMGFEITDSMWPEGQGSGVHGQPLAF